MERTRLAALVAGLAFLIAACSSAVQADRDGSTPERAIVFPGLETSFEAIPLEEEWVATHHPGAEVLQQDLVERDGRPFDRLTLRTPDGEARILFFDLTATSQPEGETP